MSANPLPVDDLHIDELLKLCVQKRGSDLHVSGGTVPIIRVDGQLLATPYEELTDNDAQRIVYAILTDEQIRTYETTHELDLSYSVRSLARFRVNIYRERGGVGAAFRTIPSSIPTFNDLRLPPILLEITRKPRGLVLITGPTGSGKSTTLAAMIGQINKERSCHIVTIEDPIEYLHKNIKSLIHQRELGADTDSFKEALKRALRQDPNVILVGEMRDLDTMSLAISAAETGHLVFSTVHTNSAASTVDRIVDVFPPDQQDQIRIQLANTLEAIVTQQLLPKIGGGRIAVFEVAIAITAIRNLIRQGKAHQMTSVIQTNAEYGMQTMDQALRDAVNQGLVTREIAFTRAMNPDELKQMLD